MTNFDKLKNMSVDDFANWLNNHGHFEESPWMSWFDDNYCKKCEAIICRCESGKREIPMSWCELNDYRCKFFPAEKTMGNLEIIKAWLEYEIKEKCE